ncbi:MAG TPA: hypothetical protein VFK05_02205 [Polyangiaceae bacterium]|nr:hypothetical protein [Polyangiaceae bacterium]
MSGVRGCVIGRVLFVALVGLSLPPACGNKVRDFRRAEAGSAGEAGDPGGTAGRAGAAGTHAGGRGGTSSSGGQSVGGAGGGVLGGAGSPASDSGQGGGNSGGADCPSLTAPTNGVIDAASTSPGTKATYSCMVGYKLVGADTRTCEQGSWTGTAPTCTIQDCGALTAPADGSVAAPTTTYGATATYSCKQGYGPSGSATRTCQADGKWSGTTPTCVIANCPALASPTGGTVDAPTLTFGATATYSCNAGYTISGMATRTCQPDGTWSGTAPTCAAKDCGTLAAPSNGSISVPSTLVGATATYSCNATSGYTLSGSATRQCQTSATWSGTAPTCTLKDCGALTSPTNGSVSQSNTKVGGTATYSCNSGYVLNGNATRTCQTSGAWDGSAPTCTQKVANGGSCSNGNQCQSANCSINPANSAGMCCASGLNNCGSCVNQQSDANNCGACSNKCGLNLTCQSGSCACPGYTFPSTCGSTCGNWTFEAVGSTAWALDTDPALTLNGVNINGATNAQSSSTKPHDGSGGLSVPVLVDYSSKSIAAVAVPVCQSGNTFNFGGFKLSFWIYFAGQAFDQQSDDVFLFIGAWSASATDQGPALFKNKMLVNQWINVTYTFPIANAADHIAIRLHPGGYWQGTMYIDSVLVSPP